MKKFFSHASYLLIFSILFLFLLSPALASNSIPQVPQADESAELISAEYFFLAIKEEYAKFHIEFEATEYDPSAMYAKNLLNERLNEIRLQMESVTNYSEEYQAFVDEDVLEPYTEDDVQPYSPMPYKKVYSRTQKFDSPSGMGFANILIEIGVTIDGQYNAYMSVDSFQTRQSGLAFNFDSWSLLTEPQSKIWYDEKYKESLMQCYATGTLVVSYTEPHTGMKLSYSSDHLVGFAESLYPSYTP